MTMSIVPGPRTTSKASAARAKLEEVIERGRAKGAAVLEHIERNQPRDRLIPTSEIAFEPDLDVVGRMRVRHDRHAWPLHRNALGQASDRAGVPRTYVARLLDDDRSGFGPELLAYNLMELIRNEHADDTPLVLLRSIQRARGETEEVRGFLSSRFKRIDSRSIVGAFAAACHHAGAHIADGVVSDTRIAIRALVGHVIEPVPGEVLGVGMSLQNSDYGNGALEIAFYVLRLQCLNGLTVERSMRKVHLGARLTAEIAWSDSTRSAECDAIAGAVYDLVKSRLGETHLRHLADGIRAAHEHELSADRAHEFVKRHLAKADAEAAMAAFRGPDTITMPAGNTRWRLAQAISWIAGNSEDDEKRLDLQKVAGQLVPMTEAA